MLDNLQKQNEHIEFYGATNVPLNKDSFLLTKVSHIQNPHQMRNLPLQ